jgi:uncharacterized membrane protein YfhO
VNRIFRGVVVPAGSHKVVFSYEPSSFARGAGISLGSVMLTVLIAAGTVFRRLRRPAERAEDVA